MKVSEMMTRDVRVASPDQTIRDAAAVMAEQDVGSLPVGENDRLVGMITDRDMVVRAIAKGHGADTHVRDVMTDDIKYCYDDEDADRIARDMADLHLRRLPVINRDKRLVGIVSLANVTRTGDGKAAETVLQGVAQPH
ncbi:CBS domain-containing protein [Luteimonas suaedae]|uniref:CBS domain-containing protein n=1 Tax=Luteimonas suaedae TaxID=2605430 RepID=UPI0011ED2186|nr:CBS domain-containing protein [Luteimonas suaedae]